MITEEGKNQANPEENADAAQVIGTVEGIAGQAQSGVSSATNEGGPENSVADIFRSLPMRELIGGPLFPVAEAQEELAGIEKIAFSNEDDSNSTDTTDVPTSASAEYFSVQASNSDEDSSSCENISTTDQTTKYQVHVTACQNPQSEGLSKLLDIMASILDSENFGK